MGGIPGFNFQDFDDANKVLDDEKSKEAARQALQAAEKSRSIPELEKAIQQSQDAGLSPTDRNAADKVLREEKLKHALAAALKSRSIPDLEKAIQDLKEAVEQGQG